SLDGIKSIYDNKLFHIEKPGGSGGKFSGWIILIILILGILAGFAGGGLMLMTRKIAIPFLGEYSLENYLPKREVTIETVKDVTVTEETRVAEVIDDMQKKTVDIYVKQKATNDLVSQVILPSEVLVRGVVLSSDGWIISLDRGFDLDKVSYVNDKSDETDQLHDYFIVTSDNKHYPVTKILKDPNSEIVFLKTDAKDLASAKIGTKDDLTLGEVLLVFASDRYLETGVGQNNYQVPTKDNSIMKSTDSFSDYVLLTTDVYNAQAGSPAVDLSGAVIGLMAEKNVIMPTLYLRNLITQVLGGGNDLENGTYLSRPFFGVDYIDLHKQKGITDDRFKDLTSGALVYGNPTAGGPAAIAGIKNADVILQINGENVNGRRNLSELIWQYSPESTLDVKVLSGGKEKNLNVVLGELNVK
ncbi:MAG: S1C family serine protease, partial [Patescibacteria group bacterium]